jgi:hypothetical protein
VVVVLPIGETSWHRFCAELRKAEVHVVEKWIRLNRLEQSRLIAL